MKLVRMLVLAVLATLLLATATAFACTVHALGGAAAMGAPIPTSLDLLFAPRPTVTGLRVLSNLNPGGGYHGDVWAHRGVAYLSSWHGDDCPGTGVRVIGRASCRERVWIPV